MYEESAMLQKAVTAIEIGGPLDKHRIVAVVEGYDDGIGPDKDAADQGFAYHVEIVGASTKAEGEQSRKRPGSMS